MAHTQKSLEKLTMAEIVRHYNGMAAGAGKQQVKEFKNKDMAVKRVLALQKETAPPKPAKVSKAPEAEAAPKVAKKSSAEPATAKVAKAKPLTKLAKYALRPASDPKPAKLQNKGIGKLAVDLLKAGKSTEEVIAGVVAQIPQAQISRMSVVWYRSQIKTGRA